MHYILRLQSSKYTIRCIRRKKINVHHILSSLQRLLLFTQASCSFSPALSLSLNPTPSPRSTHSLLSISDSRDKARANANRSSSPLKMELVFSACIDRPRSSIIMRIASDRSLPSSTELLMSVSERKRLVRGTSEVRTSFACFINQSGLVDGDYKGGCGDG